MAKPRLIILIRHAQSEGNKNREIHQTTPDHRVKLTPEGWQQAQDAGRRLRAMLRADDTLHFFTSPYRRARETTEGILSTLASDESDPSPFERNNIKVYEEPRLREQDFGNFQPCSAEMERMWQERADYGHFFYRIPNGESAADAYDRVSGFNESLWRQFGEDDFASVCVLVTHGLMSRVFLMKWYHFTVEYFEDLRNINHCEFLVMRREEESGKYRLENKLRTWTDLRQERERAALKAKADEGKDAAAHTAPAKDSPKPDRPAVVSAPVTARRWGGCPNGCDHDKTFKIRAGFADLIQRDGTAVFTHDTIEMKSALTNGTTVFTHDTLSLSPALTNGDATTTTPAAAAPSLSSSSLATRRPAARCFHPVGGANSDDGEGDDEGGDEERSVPQIDITRAREEVVSSPAATPSFITVDDRLRAQASPPCQFHHHHQQQHHQHRHLGRDFGGTYSGHASDADSSEDDAARRRRGLKVIGPGASDSGVGKREHSAGAPRNNSHALAYRLGDSSYCSDCDNEGQDDSDTALDQKKKAAAAAALPLAAKAQLSADTDSVDDDITEAEREDRSLQGSVY